MRSKILKLFQTLLICFSVLFTGNATAQTFLSTLPDNKPNKILIDQNDRFFLDYGRRIYVFSDKVDYTVEINDPDPDFSGYGFDFVVSPQGVIYSLFYSSYTPRKSNTTYYRLNLAVCPSTICTYVQLANWSNTEGQESRTDYTYSDLKISKTDNLFFQINYSFDSGGKNIKNRTFKNETYSYYNQQKIPEREYRERVRQQFPPPKSGVIVQDETKFNVNGVVQEHPSNRSTRYTRTEILDLEENPHIFFHDPADRNFYHQFYSKTQNAVVEQLVDSAESGLENIAFATKDEIWSLHYFYRDAFNKGLLVTIHQLSDGTIARQFVLDASKTRNSGWDLMGSQSSAGRILFTYLSNKFENQREFVLLNQIEDLEILGDNLAKFGHPKGEGFLEEMDSPEEESQLIQDLSTSHLTERKNYELNLGVGIQFVSSSANVGEPQECIKQPDGTCEYVSAAPNPYQPKYQYSDGLLNIFSLEGVYGSTNFGIDFISKRIDEKVDAGGSEEAKKFNQLKGQLGFRKLFFDFDVKVELEKMTTSLFFEDESKQVAPREFEVDFQEMKLSLITLKRMQYGLIYQTYEFFQPVYIYFAPEGSTKYRYHSQAIGAINSTNYMFHAGYSTLDYLVKYETEISDWFVDAEIRAGVSIAEFDSETQTTGAKPSTEYTLILGFPLEVGWIWYKRWEILNQIGGAIKLSYRYDYMSVGNSDKPDDLREPAGSDDYVFAYERTEVRQGPILFASFNF